MPAAHVLGSLLRRLGLGRDEARPLALMGALCATLMCAYTVAKVLRDALFLKEFGALSLPYAYVGVALAAVAFVWFESVIAQHFTRVGATWFNQYTAIGFSVLAALALPHARHWTTAAFYLWTGSQAMMLLPHFWLLALEVWDSRSARRVFPLLAGCGLIGGLTGGAIAAGSVALGHVGLMWILTGLLVAAHVLTRIAAPRRTSRVAVLDASPGVSSWEIIRRSPYIKVMVVGLALSVIVGTLVDFQFKLLIQQIYPEPRALTRFLGTFYVGLNALALLFQFGAAGWLLQRVGLGTATGLQPGTVLLFATLTAVTTGGWAVIVMRWIQGVVSQTLGKSAAEIYYAAIRPSERRRIKPAIDTLVERWSDAAVGIALIVVLRVLHVPDILIAVGTALLAATWIVVVLRLNRHYGRAFEQALSSRWIEPEAAPESMRIPSARKALLLALNDADEHRIVFALKLSESANDPAIARAVQGCLRHASPGVRTAAMGAMAEQRLRDPDGTIAGCLRDPDDAVRRAAVGYLLVMSADPVAFARDLLEGEDTVLRQHVVDLLFDRHSEARSVLTPAWLDARIAAGTREDLLLAARALGAVPARAASPRLRALLAHTDAEVQRLALRSATRRPDLGFVDLLLPMLLSPELSRDARQALAAIGDPAVAALRQALDGDQGERARTLAARVLAQIATPRAIDALMRLARSADVRLRHLGLHSLAQVRANTGRPSLARALAHRLFLRELREYRACLEPARALADAAVPEIRLLGESYGEFADMALERAFDALACWYEPRPLPGAFERLRSHDPARASTALEYLGHILPRAVFRPMSRIFEPRGSKAPAVESEADAVTRWIRAAWDSQDGWLRACAVRAARHVPTFDLQLFAAADAGDRTVRAELAAMALPARVASEGGARC